MLFPLFGLFSGLKLVFVNVAKLILALEKVKLVRKAVAGLIFVLTRVGYFFNE